MHKFCSLRLLILALFITLLAGCSTPQPVDRPIDRDLSRQVQDELKKARSLSSPDREYHQIKAAMILQQAGDNSAAIEVLSQVDNSQLGFDSFLNYSLVYSAASLANDDYTQAKLLTTAPRLLDNWPLIAIEHQRQLLDRRAETQLLLGEELQAVDSYYQLSKLTLNDTDKQRVNNQLWIALNQLSAQQLSSPASREPELAQWQKLALAHINSRGNLRQQIKLFSRWQNANPKHPAAKYPPEQLSTLSSLSSALPQRLALLLPASGNLSKAGKAIQSGFLAAWFDAQENFADAPEVKFYDSASGVAIHELYATAVADGAELVIGPLDKNRVAELAQSDSLSVPTIALNYLDHNQSEPDLAVEPITTTTLVQLGLAAEDEAQQIARHAWQQGHRSALALYPQTQWAQRVADAFQRQWLALGGTLEPVAPYPTSLNDFAPLLKPVLHINQSNSRNQRLERLLGQNLHFTPRRRQDLDMVFLVAYPNQARQIKPTLNFLFAADLPVYATSHIYNGTQQRGRNRDLDNIQFSAMPWTLEGYLPERLKPDTSIDSNYRQLYALGMDVYLLQQWLSYLQSSTSASLDGSTGTLRLQPGGEIYREHPWAVFKSGRVKPAPGIK